MRRRPGQNQSAHGLKFFVLLMPATRRLESARDLLRVAQRREVEQFCAFGQCAVASGNENHLLKLAKGGSASKLKIDKWRITRRNK